MNRFAVRFFSLSGTLLFAAFPLLCYSEPGGGPVYFEKDIRPILKEHCFHCHGEEADDVKAGLDVRLRRSLEKGGKSGPAIVPGDAGESHILDLLKAGDMPKGKKRLPDRDIALIEKWIATGAPTARPEPEFLDGPAAFTEEERAWWSFQPITSPEVPETKMTKSSNPIDAFVGKKLEESKLTFSEEAGPGPLIRRLCYDLTGLPPKPEEITAFTEQAKYDPEAAFDALLDRLLASPAYGERWARHWLDIVGYADSDGYNEIDSERKYAWRYRDYVIRCLNNDKPYDQFVQEQIAGDELAAKEGLNQNSPTEREKLRYSELIAATGFLRMAPDGSASKNDIETRNDTISATMKIVSTTLYGMTIGCAQCHDHRYDPITQADYYRLRAVFDPGFDVNRWRTPANRLVSLQTKEEKTEADRIENEAKKIDLEKTEKEKQFIDEVLEKELAKRDEAIRESLKSAFNTPEKERTAEQTKLLKSQPSINNLAPSRLYLYDTTYKTKNAAVILEIAARAKVIRETKPELSYIQAFFELPKKPTEVAASHVFYRGDPESPKEKVMPGDLSVLAGFRKVEIPEFSDLVPSTGRRLEFAESITDGKHPLLARVIVNRVWMHHFGKGLVATLGDFGKLGEKPSHPELLDWLANRFMESGWSLKELHRLILTSQTWRQQSIRTEDRDELDPDNRLLSRQNSRRLEAEVLRDALLDVSGKLNLKPFGPPVPVMPTEEGGIVIGNDTTDTAGRQTGKFIPLNGEEFRRSIYIQVRRTRPLDMFAAFDAPTMAEDNCELRTVTTVSPQSLLLMNNVGMRQHARHFAEFLQSRGGPDLAGKIREAWLLCYGREVSEDEAKAAEIFIEAQTGYYKENPTNFETVAGPVEKGNAAPELLALGAFCHALMSANEFLYID